MGQLIGFNPKLKSYRILTEGGIIINSKNVTFLNYVPPANSLNNGDELLLEEKTESLREVIPQDTGEKEEIKIKEEEEEDRVPAMKEMLKILTTLMMTLMKTMMTWPIL
jgi:hypothetical protein